MKKALKTKRYVFMNIYYTKEFVCLVDIKLIISIF